MRINFKNATVGVIACCIFYSSNSNAKEDMSSSITTIRLGDPRNSEIGGPGSSIDNHPSGAIFYQREWSRGKLGVIQFLNGDHGFSVDNVLSILGSADKDVDGGIYKWSISFGISAQQADTHEAALARVMKLFSVLRNAGWSRYIDTFDPRLNGEQAWTYFTAKTLYSIDGSYTPTLNEWVAAIREMPQWKFYSNGIYLKVSITESNFGGFADKSVYLLSIDVENEYAFYGLGYFPGDAEKIKNWKKFLPNELKKYHATRVMKETALKAKGYSIDATYQDPPIKALQASPNGQ